MTPAQLLDMIEELGFIPPHEALVEKTGLSQAALNKVKKEARARGFEPMISYRKTLIEKYSIELKEQLQRELDSRLI